MRRWEPVRAPEDRAVVRWVVDCAAVVLAFAASLPDLFRHHAGQPTIHVIVLTIVVVPLIVRRRYPVPVFAWVIVAGGAAVLWTDRVHAVAAVLIALYTVTASQSRRTTLWSVAVLELAVVAATVREAGDEWWYDTIFLSALVGGTVGLGLYSATRRAYLAELQDRAKRLERERDQQGALAAAAERARIAREMHDIVAHHLTVMVALSDGAIVATASSPERGIEVMRTVSTTGRRALLDTRRLLGVLRTDPHRSGIDGVTETHRPVPDLASLDELLEQVRSAGLPTTLEIHGASPTVPAGVQSTVYRLVQEALTNTLKHAGTDVHASVRIRFFPGEIQVEVHDDGLGAATGAADTHGGGLAGMHERVHVYGGTVRSGPTPTGGWRVSALLPVDAVDPSGDS